MKKSLFFVAAASALLLTACSSENEATQIATQQEAPQAIAFDTYVPTTTRAVSGWSGTMNTEALQSSSKANGFGVFAVQSDNSVYVKTQTTNFMYNEHVTYASPGWSYSPIKYWPNETDNDSQSAEAASSNIDRLSFFAYAPYVAPSSTAAEAAKGRINNVTYSSDPTATAPNSTDEGIIAVNANNDATNDPYVWYRVSSVPKNSVDLLWGVAPAGDLTYTSVAAGLDNTAGVAQIDDAVVTVAEGKPLVDLIKPSKDEKMKFLFKHALARIGVTVVAAIDQIAPGGDFENTDGAPAYTKSDATHVAVESITIQDVSSSQKLFTLGRLNLNNTNAGQALWEETGGGAFSQTIDATHELSDEIKWDTDVTTTLGQTNFNGVDKTERYAIREDGVKTKAVRYFMVIPSHASTDLKVTITYHVFTEDAKLATGYATTTNVINKTITIPALTNNKAYNLKLVLGLTSVKLDAEVADWQIDGSSIIDLPRNNE